MGQKSDTFSNLLKNQVIGFFQNVLHIEKVFVKQIKNLVPNCVYRWR